MSLRITVEEDRLITRAGMRAPHLLKLKNGDLLLNYHVDPDMHFARRAGMRSSDNGRTWRDDAPRSYKEMAWGELANGVVLAFDRDAFEAHPGVFLGSFFRSGDGGSTFEGPLESRQYIASAAARDYPVASRHYPEEHHPQFKFFSAVPEYYRPAVAATGGCRRGFGFWRYILEQEGLLLVAMHGHFHGDVAQRSILAASEDEGRNWHYVATIAYEHDRMSNGMCEPVLCRTAAGNLLCVMRRHGIAKKNMAQCRSTDGGRTWTDPQVLPAHGVDPDLCLMSSGVLACSYGRPGLHIMFSEDGCGHAWGYRTELGRCRSSAQMGMVEIEPGRLLIVYDQVDSNAPEAGRRPEHCSIRGLTVKVTRC